MVADPNGILHPHLKTVLVFGHEPDNDVDVDVDLLQWVPADPAHFGVTVQLLIGDEHEDDADAFDIIVCAPRWFATYWGRLDELVGEHGLSGRWPSGVRVGKDYWFMERWDGAAFMDAVTALLARVSGRSWAEVATQLALDMRWEYE